jgi:Domain of unknown function (DUF4349)
MTMHAQDDSDGDGDGDARLGELLGRLKEPVPAEDLEGAWRIIDSKLERRKPMNSLALTHSGRRPRLLTAMAAAAVLLLAFVVGLSGTSMRHSGFGGLLGGSNMEPPAPPKDSEFTDWDGYGAAETDRGILADKTRISGGPGGGGVSGRYGKEKESSVTWAVPAKTPPATKVYQDVAEAREALLERDKKNFVDALRVMAKEVARTRNVVHGNKSDGSKSGKGGARDGRYEPSAPPAKPGLPTVKRPSGRPGDPRGPKTTKGKQASPGRSAQKIIKTATLKLEVRKFIEASRKVDALVASHGGFYADSKVNQNDDGTAGGYYVIRVPQARFEALYAELKKLGRVRVENAKGQDVTAQYTDMNARIRNLQHIEKRLLALLVEKKRKGKMSEILEVERELGKRREQVERMLGLMRVLVDKISFGTVYLTVSEPARTVPGASFTVEVKDASAADKGLDPLMAGLHGQVASRQVSKRRDGTKQVDVTLKVPMTRFGDLLTAVKAMGRPDKESVQGFNPAAIRTDDGAKDVVSIVRVVLFEPSRQKPGGVANIEVKTLEDASKAIGALLEQLGGTQTSRNEQRRDGSATATYQIRVPRAKFAQLASAIEAGIIGRLTNKQMIGVDVVDVTGPLAKVPCDLTLTIFERVRQKPKASATLVAADLAGAGQAIRNLLKTVEGQLTNHVENRRPGGTSTAVYELRCPRDKFTALLAGLEPIGRLENKSVSGLDLEDVEGAAAKVLCSMRLTVMEKVPGAHLVVEVVDMVETKTRIEALVKSVGATTETLNKKRESNGTREQTWILRVPVVKFGQFVDAVEKFGAVKYHAVVGLGEEAKSLAARNASAQVKLIVRQPAPLTAASEGTLTGTLSAAFKTLWWVLAVVLYGLIVVVPIILIIAFAIKALGWMLRSRRPVAPVATVPAADTTSTSQDAHRDE